MIESAAALHSAQKLGIGGYRTRLTYGAAAQRRAVLMRTVLAQMLERFPSSDEG
jgi:hypothetical protein